MYSPTGHVGVDRRRLLQAGEGSRRSPVARGQADIGPGQQGAEPRHAAYTDPRLDDPEGGPLAQVRFGAGNHLGGDDDVLEVRRDRDRPRGADLDVEVAQLGLARLQPLGGREAQRDRRALLGVGPIGQEGADQGGHDRDQPDDRDPSPPLDSRPRAGQTRSGRRPSSVHRPSPTSASGRTPSPRTICASLTRSFEKKR